MTAKIMKRIVETSERMFLTVRNILCGDLKMNFTKKQKIIIANTKLLSKIMKKNFSEIVIKMNLMIVKTEKLIQCMIIQIKR